MIRTLGGIAGGIAVAILVMMIVEAIGVRLYPPAAAIDPAADIELSQPDAPPGTALGTLMVPVIGWFLGPLAGGMIAVWLSGRRWTAFLVAAAVLIGAMLQFMLSTHPWWMIAGLIAPLVAALLAQQFAPRQPEDSAGEDAASG